MTSLFSEKYKKIHILRKNFSQSLAGNLCVGRILKLNFTALCIIKPKIMVLFVKKRLSIETIYGLLPRKAM